MNPHKRLAMQLGAHRDTKCRCGSGHERYDLVDARGNFCEYVCVKCEPEKRRKYRHGALNDYNDPCFDYETDE